MGDYIVTPIGVMGRAQAPELPEEKDVPKTAMLPDYFWYIFLFQALVGLYSNDGPGLRR